MFFEPNWETSKNEWWTFKRADSQPWALVGLWNALTDKDSGEIIESYTMLTMNADDHPIMRRMHKPDPKLAPDKQDKWSVVAVETNNIEIWLHGSVEEASSLIRLSDPAIFSAAPAQ
jgi:putative SOS response-associated peptidase YedK